MFFSRDECFQRFQNSIVARHCVKVHVFKERNCAKRSYFRLNRMNLCENNVFYRGGLFTTIFNYSCNFPVPWAPPSFSRSICWKVYMPLNECCLIPCIFSFPHWTFPENRHIWALRYQLDRFKTFTNSLKPPDRGILLSADGPAHRRGGRGLHKQFDRFPLGAQLKII